MTFGEKLRELREARGLSQKALADATGQTQPSIGRWEIGAHYPPANVLHILCKALGVKLSAFDGVSFEQAEEKRGRGRPKKK